MALTIQMRGNYPSIASGVISFQNIVTGAEVRIGIPKGLAKNIYGIKEITIDSGASSTVFPESFAGSIDIKCPPRNAEEYWIFSGVGGASIGFRTRVPIKIGISDDKEEAKAEAIIFPFCLVECAPSTTSEGKLLARREYQPYTEDAIRFLSPPSQHRDDYTVEIHSPTGEFPPQRRRLKLEVDVGQDMDYILIGRDWQEGFDILFKEEEMIIKERREG